MKDKFISFILVGKSVVSNRDNSVLMFCQPWEKCQPEDHPWVKTGSARICETYIKTGIKYG